MVQYDGRTLEGLSDHVALSVALPVAVSAPTPRGTQQPPAAAAYRWDVGPSSDDHVEGIATWKRHTDTPAFQNGLMRIVEDASLSDEAKSAAVEQFLLREGQAAGVITAWEPKAPLNPNRWGKCMAPWFGEECREAKK